MGIYQYLSICLLLFIPWTIIFYFKKEFRSRMIKTGLLAAPFGVINMWFRIDYWEAPEVLMLSNLISLEDALFGFVTTGISVTLFDALFNKKNSPSTKSPTKTLLLFFPLVFGSYFILNNGLGFNSMFMFCWPLNALTIAMVLIRKDLFLPSIVTGVLCVLMALVIYIYLFDFVSPDFWKTYWFLWGTNIGWTIFGNVPVLEMYWYFSWATYVSILYNFATGSRRITNEL